MRSKLVTVSVLAGLALASQVASAHDHGRFRDGDDYGRYDEGYRGHGRDFGRDFDRDERFARVVDVDPLVDRVRVVEPYQECRRDWRQERGGVVMRRDSDPGAAIVGGVVGAVIGHNLVSDRDRGVGTVAGALVGGALGNELGARGYREEYVPPRAYEVERCRDRPVERWQERVVGYRVTYVYAGRQYTTRMAYDPGRSLRVDYSGRPFGP